MDEIELILTYEETRALMDCMTIAISHVSTSEAHIELGTAEMLSNRLRKLKDKVQSQI